MPLYTTPDGRYTVAWETPGAVERGEADGNSVIYDRGPDLALPWPGAPVWDRFRHEAELGETPQAPPVDPPQAPPSQPLPSAGELSFPVQDVRLIKVTDEQDGWIPRRMMSYWPNAWRDGGGDIWVFCGHQDNLPRFFRVRLPSGDIERKGSLGISYLGETEGWYWERGGTLILYDGPRLRRVSPFSGRDEVIFDISTVRGIPTPNKLWQPHSSEDGLTHSATVIQMVDPYPKVGTVLFANERVDYFPAQGKLDESAITSNASHLIIKEDTGEGDDNRIITIRNRETRYIKDRERAMGHSDCGPNYVVGEADKPDPGMAGWWDLGGPLNIESFHPLFQTLNMGYMAVRGNRILHSGETQLRVIDRLSGSIQTLFDHGGGRDYDDRVKASLSPCGTVACFMSAFGGSRQDVWVAVLT